MTKTNSANIIRITNDSRFSGIADGSVVGKFAGVGEDVCVDVGVDEGEMVVSGERVGFVVGWGVDEGVDACVGVGVAVGCGGVSRVNMQLNVDVSPALLMNWTNIVFWPSPPCRVQVFDDAYGSQLDQNELSFENRICAIPAKVSVADKVSVIIGLLVIDGVVMVPVGGVLSS